VRTTNPVERLHAEIEKATGRVAAWRHSKSWERRMYLVWTRVKETQCRPTKPSLAFAQDS